MFVICLRPFRKDRPLGIFVSKSCLNYFHIGPEDAVTMVTFQRSGAASKDTYLKYLGEIPDLIQITFCFRLYLSQARDEIMVLSYAHPENDNELYFGEYWLDFNKVIYTT